jgi:SAM-dependent methyltransferase
LRNWRTAYAPTSTVFTDIYRKNRWGGESVSGEGSDINQTKSVRDKLPDLLQTYSVRTLLDLPCGTFYWMQKVDLGGIAYIGGDIVPELIEQNNARYRSVSREFRVLDLIKDQLPPADLLLCRDCLIHLSFRDMESALRNIAQSGIPYLLTTNYPHITLNTDIVTGDFRAINLQLAPFRFPKPITVIPEDIFPKLKDNPNFIRELALWRTQDIALGQTRT